MPKISVIVPAYNAEKYLPATLDCLLAQTLKAVEIIIVNDGSTDSTQELIDAYTAPDRGPTTIRSIFQPNAGVSAARNRGLEAASGDYVLFLDADDLLTPPSLEAFYTALTATGADMAIGRLQSFGASAESYNPFADALACETAIGVFDKRLLWNFLVGNKCYKREALLASGVRFPPLRYAEEGAFFMEFVLGARPKITGAPGACMQYRRHSEHEGFSVSQSVSLALVQDFYASLTRIYTAAQTALADADAQTGADYLQEVLYKTAHILLAQFYRLLWRADDACLAYIGQVYGEVTAKMTEATRAKLLTEHADLGKPLFTKAAVAAGARVSVILPAADTAALKAVYAQSMPLFEVYVPAGVYDAAEFPAQNRQRENLHVLPDKDFLRHAKAQAKAPCLIWRGGTALDARAFRYVLRMKLPGTLKQRLFGPLVRAVSAAARRANR